MAVRHSKGSAMADTGMRIAADIGGTHARFALVDGAGDLHEVRVLPVAEHGSAAAAKQFNDIREFLRNTDDARELSYEIEHRLAEFTHGDWDEQELRLLLRPFAERRSEAASA